MNKIKETLEDVKGYITAGMGYMLPLIVVGGICMALSTILPKGELNNTLKFISDVGLQKYDIFVIMFIAYAAANKVVFAPAFIVGVYSNSLGLGIFGALINGIIIGILCKELMSIKLKGSAKALFSMIIVPLVVTILVMLVTKYVLNDPVMWLSTTLTNALGNMAGKNAMVLGAILGAMIGFDLGGPVNKIAGLFAMSMLTEGVRWPMTLAATVYMLPSLGAGLATILDRKKVLFDRDEHIAGVSAFVMGFLLLSEPAIPFMMADPTFMILANVTMSALLGGLYAFFQITAGVTLGPIFSFGVTNKPVLALVILVVITIALALIIVQRRKTLLKKGKLDFSYDE